jgi:hypothetical protein
MPLVRWEMAQICHLVGWVRDMPMIGWGKAQICHWMGGEKPKYATSWMRKCSYMPTDWVGKGYANDRVGKGSIMPLVGWEMAQICHLVGG